MATRQTKQDRIQDPDWYKRYPIKNLDFVLPCRYCGKDADTWDHAIPTSRGGANRPDNKFPTCKKCNNDKRHMTHDEYVLYLSRGRDERIRLVSEIVLLTQKAKDTKPEDHDRRERIYINRLALCVRAADQGVPIRFLASIVDAGHANRLRRKINKRRKEVASERN